MRCGIWTGGQGKARRCLGARSAKQRDSSRDGKTDATQVAARGCSQREMRMRMCLLGNGLVAEWFGRPRADGGARVARGTVQIKRQGRSVRRDRHSLHKATKPASKTHVCDAASVVGYRSARDYAS